MKQQIHFPLLLLICSTFLLQSCLQDACDASQTFIRFDPIYLSAEDIRQEVESHSIRGLKNPGKIYYYQQYMFINERQEGIHVIDNSDPKQPENIAFISIPGNVDMAVRGNTLYADSYMDLLLIDISTITNPNLVERQEEVFINNFPFDQNRGYIIGYEETSVTQRIDCNDPRFGQPNFWWQGGFFERNDLVNSVSADFAGGQTQTSSNGVGGSMARFAIYQDFLYVIDNSELKVFNIQVEDKINQLNTVSVGWGIETIFPYEDKLFVGADHGMYIFNNDNPIEPTFASLFTHARACDPVVVEGETAYVTLRDGTFCEGFANQMDIVDISDVFNPRLIESHEMDNPHGLAVRDGIVYLCDGESGLRVLDVKSPKDVKELDREKFKTYDAIALPGSDLVMVIGDDGFYQFDASNPKNLERLSVIPVEK